MGRIEVFDNPHPQRHYVIRHEVEEFTSLCPKTGHPDFAEISISYIAQDSCLELKSLKLYLQGFRDEGIFYEDVTNRILDDLVDACAPLWMEVESRWSTRGGIHSVITAEYHREDAFDDDHVFDDSER